VFIAALILWLTSSIFTQIAATGISMEGKAWWLLKIAPISPAELLRGKFVVAWVPYAILSTVLFVGAGIWQGFSLFGFVYGWFGIELLGTGFLLVALGFAVPWARFDWDDPRRMSSGWGWLFTTIVQYLMGLIGGVLLALPLIAQAFAPQWVLPAYAVGVLVTVGGVAVVSFLVVQFGLSRLPSTGEA
jgi:ABC-2 type transport system permease protein